MSKVTKLVTKPNLFFRDYFLKKAPLSQAEKRSLMPTPTVAPVKKKAATVSPAKKPAPVTPPSPPQKSTANDLAQIAEDIYPVTFPIDIVYTWVNSDDEEFNESRLKYQQQFDSSVKATKAESTDIARFESRDELKYSIRSILTYAPWVNHIYIVTNGQVPSWLNEDWDKVTIVPHSQILEPEFLPTFNSHAIETALYKIPNLSEHFIYFNDDVMLTRPLPPSYFFTSGGIAKLFATGAKLPNGEKSINDSPTQWAAKNSRALLLQETGFWVDVMFAHTFHPQLKSVHQEINELWKHEVDLCRNNKFRDGSDLNVATFLHHHLALIRGKAIATRTKCMYFNIREQQAEKLYKTLLAQKGSGQATHSLCLNDRVSSGLNVLEDFDVKLRNFLEAYYPNPTDAEIFVPTKKQLTKMVSERKFVKVYEIIEGLSADVFPASKHELEYLHYYFGMACWFIYQDKSEQEFLERAYQHLQRFCDKNPKHKLACEYLEQVTVVLLGAISEEKNSNPDDEPKNEDNAQHEQVGPVTEHE